MYSLSEESIQFLKEILEEFGPSGFEDRVLKRIRNRMEKYSDQVIKDNLNSLIFVKRGSSERPKVIVAGHVDEVGFVVTSITKDGYLTFTNLGGWFDQVLLAQKVIIMTNKGPVLGVITSKPPHL
ncbi:MAG: peptidase M28, partial [Candidatus Methanomethylicia archaeon]